MNKSYLLLYDEKGKLLDVCESQGQVLETICDLISGFISASAGTIISQGRMDLPSFKMEQFRRSK